MRALNSALSLLDQPSKPRTIEDLLQAYKRDGIEHLSPVTRKHYTMLIDTVLIPVFGGGRIGALTPAMIAQYLQKGVENGRAVAANRERSVLGSAYNYAMRRGLAEANPTLGVRRNTERPARRYVTDKEFRMLVLRAPAPFRLLVWTAYLTGMRLTDLVLLSRNQVTKQGLEVTESKTGKRRLYTWTPLLRCVIDRALARSRCDRVLTNRFGKPWGQWAVSSQMRRQAPGFRFRDLRPKAASDAEHNVLGHSGQMLTRYVRRETLRPVR